jgi:ArsR family transcriptional regulator
MVMTNAPADLKNFEAHATEVAQILRALANERRLMVLCKLVEWGETNVGDLAEAVGLSQSALSQHLAKMRGEGIVATRRDSLSLAANMLESGRAGACHETGSIGTLAKSSKPAASSRANPRTPARGLYMRRVDRTAVLSFYYSAAFRRSQPMQPHAHQSEKTTASHQANGSAYPSR